MFSIDAAAAAMFTRTLEDTQTKPGQVIRLTNAEDDTGKFVFIIDQARPADIKKTNQEGRVVFVINEDLIPDINSLTLTYEGRQFKFAKSQPD